jgi:adenosylcobyric acid synthase
MNPVLLKPQGEAGAQVVVQGQVWGNARARAFQTMKPAFLPKVLDSFARLRAAAELIIVEGAGSAAEINLRACDIANMGFARATGTPVVLVGDIDRGGVIASLVGTRMVLDPTDAALVRGFIVNRMRGDPSLFASGMRLIAERTGWAPLGLVPFLECARALPAEDAADLESRPRSDGPIVVAVPMLPNIANFDDLDPLAAEPAIALDLVPLSQPLRADTRLVILPGSKATIADLRRLRQEGWDTDIRAHCRRGGMVLGLCGGYQMLGRCIVDPDGTEGPPETIDGLGLLDVETVLTGEKRLALVDGTSQDDGVPFVGYEMHVGRTEGPDTARPVLRHADGRVEGAQSPNGRVFGTYAHGLFADDRQRAAWLTRLGAPAATGLGYAARIELTLDGLAEHLERHVDVTALFGLAR